MKTETLRELIRAREFLHMPAVYDPLGGLLVQEQRLQGLLPRRLRHRRRARDFRAAADHDRAGGARGRGGQTGSTGIS
jgi:hypothetical protein